MREKIQNLIDDLTFKIDKLNKADDECKLLVYENASEALDGAAEARSLVIKSCAEGSVLKEHLSDLYKIRYTLEELDED